MVCWTNNSDGGDSFREVSADATEWTNRTASRGDASVTRNLIAHGVNRTVNTMSRNAIYGLAKGVCRKEQQEQLQGELGVSSRYPFLFMRYPLLFIMISI